jgi:hypothetical protein
MTSVGETAATATADWRSIVRAGVQLGVVTAVGVAVFALLSRVTAGTSETIIQSVLVLAGGAVFAFAPSMLLRPRDIDGIAWAAMIGLLGALVFTVIDTVLFRPLDLYHWTWDAIGGGSGFWYIPVWWMGSAFLAWLGAWVVTASSRTVERAIPHLAAQTVGMGVVLGGILMATRVLPFHSAGFALAFALGLVVHLLLAGVMHKG